MSKNKRIFSGLAWMLVGLMACTNGEPAEKCGNGTQDPGETCDPPETCPTECDDHDVCTVDTLVGSAKDCTAACDHEPLLECIADDGCCPVSCNPDNDNDCVWKIHSIETNSDIRHSADIALDKNGGIHIAYVYEVRRTELRYATWAGEDWKTERVQTANSVGPPVMAIDSTGRPHVGMLTDGFPTHFGYDGSEWQVDRTTQEKQSKSLSMALDSDNHPQMVYIEIDGDQELLKYASWDGIQWQQSLIDSELGLTLHPGSLALDSLGRPHLCVSKFIRPMPIEWELRYVRLDRAEWTEPVAISNQGGNWCSLSISENDAIAISFHGNQDSLMLATKAASTDWDVIVIQDKPPNAFEFARNNDIAIASDGTVHISYFGDNQVWYATNADTTNGWLILPATDVTDWNSKYISLVVDGLARPHIAYVNHNQLWYATF